MPAKQKYLSTGWQSFQRITAGVLGGYFVTMFLQLAIAVWWSLAPTLVTSTYSSFMIWVACMCFPFWIKKTWVIWLIYIGVASACYLLVMLGKAELSL